MIYLYGNPSVVYHYFVSWVGKDGKFHNVEVTMDHPITYKAVLDLQDKIQLLPDAMGSCTIVNIYNLSPSNCM